jgi:hypothetical protein
MLRGSLSTPSLSLFLLSCGIKSSITSMSILMFLLIVFYPEIPNSSTQLFIFVILPFEYLMLLSYSLSPLIAFTFFSNFPISAQFG